MTPQTFLMATIGVESGQLLPIFAVAQTLVERGHSVRMLLSTPPGADPASIVARADAAGCSTAVVARDTDPNLRLPTMRHALFGRTPEKIGMPVPMIHALSRAAPSFARAVAEEINELRPAVVAVDNFLTGGFVAAEAARTPAVSLFHTVYNSRRPGLIPYGAGFRPTRNPYHLARQRFWTFMHMRIARHNALPGLNAARTSLGLSPVRSVAEQEDRLARILVMSPGAFSFHRRLPGNVLHTGWPVKAVANSGAWTSPWAPDDRRSLVLLSPSTTTQAQEQVPFFTRALEAMDGLPMRGLLTTGPSTDASTFHVPENVQAVPFIPHGDVLPHAAAIVSHCGHGTVMTALSHGVPIVCVPFGRDQYDVAARVSVQHAGLELSKDAGVPQIRAALNDVIGKPMYRESVRRFAAIMAAEDGAANAANEIESLARA